MQQRRTWNAFFKFLFHTCSAASIFSAVLTSKAMRFAWRISVTLWKKARISLPIREHSLTHWCFLKEKKKQKKLLLLFRWEHNILSSHCLTPFSIKDPRRSWIMLMSSSLWRVNLLGSVHWSSVYTRMFWLMMHRLIIKLYNSLPYSILSWFSFIVMYWVPLCPRHYTVYLGSNTDTIPIQWETS